MRLGPLALGLVVGAGACSGAAAQNASQAAPIVDVKRTAQISVSTDVVYDTNIAQTSQSLAQLRGIQPEDFTYRPALNFSVVQPVGQEAVFLNGRAGYDFHQVNRRLNRENIDLTGGGVAVTGVCRTTLYGDYQAQQSDLQDTTGAVVSNLLTTKGGGLSATCGRPRGFNGQFSAVHQNVTNSNAIQQPADHVGDTYSVGFGYANQSLGNLGVVASDSEQRFPNRLSAAGSIGDAYANQMLGLTYSRQVGSKLKLSAEVGEMALKRKSAPPGVPLRTTGANYTADVDYKMSSRIEIIAHSQRSFLPSNSPGKLFDLQTETELTGHYNLGTRFVISVGGILNSIDSNQDTAFALLSPTTSRKKTALASIRYKQSEKASVVFDLRQETRTTNLAVFDYSDTRATLSLAVNF
jgi:hypothetical protein